MSFDFHCHIGTLDQGGLVCTSRADEWPLVSDMPQHAIGLLEAGDDDLDALCAALEADSRAQLGEVGLDARSFRQSTAFLEGALECASSLGRMASLHVVRRHEEVIASLTRVRFTQPFIVHGFTSSPQVARRYLDLGGIISLSPRARLSRHYRQLITLPFVVESDMPLSPESRRVLDGWVAQLAQDMGIGVEELERRLEDERRVLAP